MHLPLRLNPIKGISPSLEIFFQTWWGYIFRYYKGEVSYKKLFEVGVKKLLLT